jgi:hypothetical protein
VKNSSAGCYPFELSTAFKLPEMDHEWSNGKELANKIWFQVLTTYEFVHQLKPYQKKREVEAGERMNNLMKRIFLPEQVVQHATLLRTGWVSIIQ